MGVSSAEKAIFFTKKIDFPQKKKKNVQYLNLVHVHKPNFGTMGHFTTIFWLQKLITAFLNLLHQNAADCPPADS